MANFIMIDPETRVSADEHQFIVEKRAKSKTEGKVAWKSVAFFPRLSQVYNHLVDAGLRERWSDDFTKLHEHLENITAKIAEIGDAESLKLKRISAKDMGASK